jgi:hypothetical protein
MPRWLACLAYTFLLTCICAAALPGSSADTVVVAFTVEEPGWPCIGFGVASKTGISPETGLQRDRLSAPVRLGLRLFPDAALVLQDVLPPVFTDQ